MPIMTKWRAAAAGAITLALVAGGASVANAAPGDPGTPVIPQSDQSAQPGSRGGLFLYDANTGERIADETRVFARDEEIIGSPSPTDPFAHLNAAPVWEVTQGASFDQVWRFISDKDPASLAGGHNTWKAWAFEGAAGWEPAAPDITLNAFTTGVDAVIGAGGSYWYGVAFTTNAGVTTLGAVYREINIEAGTGNYTVSPMEIVAEQGPWAPDFAGYTANASATLRNGNVEIDADAAHAGKTVDVYAEGTAAPVHTGIELDASGNAIVTSSIAAGTRLAIADTEAETVLAWATAEAFVLAEPAEGDANEVAIEAPAEGETAVVVPAGAANANQTFTPYVWSDPTVLAPVTTDAEGNASVDLAGLPVGQHTVALVDSSDEIVAWGTVTLSSTTTSATDLTVDVTTSNRFELSGVNTSVNLGTVRRGATTAPAALGAFTVIDDRDLLPGWTLNAEVADFVNSSANNDVIEKSALGLAPKQVGTAVEGVDLGDTQVAGAGTYSAVFAEGAADSSTLEAGTQFDADLTFAAPAKAKKGTYTSTLTLTLASK
ncbi:hypothetical protein [Microbacterium sp. CPCC 204701]|uniref:hypothetical protein n=1 Tax=Microbacterium sp. CPCC 204701 TaxID=2493084 RepID=UPI000FD8A7AC|nr:hypothetical protein [Microbacterium sp. CPCC 204701]